MNPLTSQSLCQFAWDERHSGEGHIDTAEGCRNRAAESVIQARHDPGRRRHFLGIAMSWLRLAAGAEKIRALMGRAKSAPRISDRSR